MATVIRRAIDIEHGTQNPEVLPNALFEGEAHAHIFQLYRLDGEPITGAITGKCLRPDQKDVDFEGQIVDGEAVISLSAGCYQVPGIVTISIYVTSGEVVDCVYQCRARVHPTNGGTHIDGGNVIETLEGLYGEAGALQTEMEALSAAVMEEMSGAVSRASMLSAPMNIFSTRQTLRGSCGGLKSQHVDGNKFWFEDTSEQAGTPTIGRLNLTGTTLHWGDYVNSPTSYSTVDGRPVPNPKYLQEGEASDFVTLPKIFTADNLGKLVLWFYAPERYLTPGESSSSNSNLMQRVVPILATRSSSGEIQCMDLPFPSGSNGFAQFNLGMLNLQTLMAAALENGNLGVYIGLYQKLLTASTPVWWGISYGEIPIERTHGSMSGYMYAAPGEYYTCTLVMNSVTIYPCLKGTCAVRFKAGNNTTFSAPGAKMPDDWDGTLVSGRTYEVVFKDCFAKVTSWT